MKKLLLISSLFIVFGSVSELKAQDASSKIIVKASRIMRYSEKDNTVTLEGDASVSTEKLLVAKAEKIVVENGSNKITVYGACNFSFLGRVVRTPNTMNQPITLEYTIGDDTVYLK